MRARIIAVAALSVAALLPGAVAQAQNHAQHYVLDAFGGVHASGGAPVITPATPYFGFDVAASIEYIAVGTGVAAGDGYIVLDKWGGVHYGGALAADPPSSISPYFGFDAARSIVRRDAPSRIAYAAPFGAIDIATGTSGYGVLATASIVAPIDGWLHVTGTAVMSCIAGGASNNLAAQLSVNVDLLSNGASVQGFAVWGDCTEVSGTTLFPAQSRTVTLVAPVAAGAHSVFLLGRKDDLSTTTGTVRFVGRQVTAQFIAQDAHGQLTFAEPVAAPVDDRYLLGRSR